MASKGSDGDDIAVRIATLTRKGKYFGKIDPDIADLLVSLDISHDYIDKMQKVQCLFPRAVMIEWLRIYMIEAWFAIHYPKEFMKEVERMKKGYK